MSCVFLRVFFESRYLCYSSPHRNGHNLSNYLCIQSRRAIFSYRASLDTKIPICVKHFTNTYYFMGVNMGVNILIRWCSQRHWSSTASKEEWWSHNTKHKHIYWLASRNNKHHSHIYITWHHHSIWFVVFFESRDGYKRCELNVHLLEYSFWHLIKSHPECELCGHICEEVYSL